MFINKDPTATPLTQLAPLHGLQGREGEQRFTLVLVLNFISLSVLPPPDRYQSQVELSLSFFLKAQAYLSFWSLWSCRALMRSLYLRVLLASTNDRAPVQSL